MSTQINTGTTVLPLTCNGVRFERHGRQLLAGATLQLGPAQDESQPAEQGGLCMLLGPNGAGKSLLLRVLANLVAPEQGEVQWAGTPPDRTRALQVGFVFQHPVMLRRSVAENVHFVLRAMGVPRAEAQDQTALVLERAKLTHVAKTPARVLSGGEQQRLALSRTLAQHPQALLLDEPTSSLDPASTLAIEQMVLDACANGTEVLMVTHDLGQARRLAHRVVFMYQGKIIEEGSAAAFFERPRTDQARRFLAGDLVL